MEYFGKAGLNGQTAKLTTVKQAREIGSSVLTCEDLSNWATDTPVFFATYKIDIDTQKIIPNSQINWRGKVNAENNTIVKIQADSDTPDKGNAIGDIVECLPTAGWANSLVDGISVIHKQDGTLKANVVKGENIDFASFKGGNMRYTKSISLSGSSTTIDLSDAPSGIKLFKVYISGSKNVGTQGSIELSIRNKPLAQQTIVGTGTNILCHAAHTNVAINNADVGYDFHGEALIVNTPWVSGSGSINGTARVLIQSFSARDGSAWSSLTLTTSVGTFFDGFITVVGM